jgi:DNA-binding CsgD family transcriptional regulator
MESIKGIEFFSFEDEVWYRTIGGEQRKLSESDPVVRWAYDHLSEFYPEALARLEEQHRRSSANVVYYRYRIVRTFCRCNFGSIDNVPDVDCSDRMHFERVACPLRGECPMEGVVCGPKFNSKISAAEMRVLELVFRQVSVEEIAERLHLSIHTVKNHKRNAYSRIGVHSTPEFIVYANDHKLFEVE